MALDNIKLKVIRKSLAWAHDAFLDTSTGVDVREKEKWLNKRGTQARYTGLFASIETALNLIETELSEYDK